MADSLPTGPHNILEFIKQNKKVPRKRYKKQSTYLVFSLVGGLLGSGELRVGGLGDIELAQRPLAVLFSLLQLLLKKGKDSRNKSTNEVMDVNHSDPNHIPNPNTHK